MSGKNYPFEYELTQYKSAPAGLQWYSVRLKNISNDPLTDLEVQIYLGDTPGTLDGENHPFGTLNPNETKTESVLAHDWEISEVHLRIHGRIQNSDFSWDSASSENEAEFRLNQKNKQKRKREAEIAEIKEKYREKDEALDKRSKKTEADVERWMTGEADS